MKGGETITARFVHNPNELGMDTDVFVVCHVCMFVMLSLFARCPAHRGLCERSYIHS